jgi:hypothetical protein
VDFTENLRLEYGVSLESISFRDRLNYMSTFGRLSYDMGPNGIVRFAYTSATDPHDLMARQGGSSDRNVDLNDDIATLNRLPHFSMRDGHMKVQRNQSYEMRYAIVEGSRTYSVSAFMEDVSNAAFLMSGAGAANIPSNDNLLLDVNSRGMIFNAGDFHRTGYTAAVTQALGEKVDVTVAGGRATALTSYALEGAATNDDLRQAIHASPRPWLTARASGSVPWSGTYLAASYGWTDFRTLVPVHYSLTDKIGQEIGWNFAVRQPLPGFGGVRMEAAAELRNLLAQGYLPIASTTGQSTILTNSPRGVRGGLSFIF